MSNSKVAFDKIIENQNQLTETLTSNVKKVMSMFEVNPEIEAFSKETAESYMAQGKEYVDSFGKVEKPEEAWNAFSSTFSKFVDFQTATYNKTAEFYRNMMENYNLEAGQEKMKEMTELYSDSFKAIVDTVEENTKVFQEMLESKK
jgi:hypothetical protein